MKHDILRDKGLEQVALSANWNGTLKIAVCRTEPTTLAHVNDVEGTNTGKRVTGEYNPPQGDITLADRTAGGREVTIAARAAAANGAVDTTQGDDLWYAVYDDTYLYQTINESSDRAINNGGPVDFGELKIGFANDA